MRRTKRPLAAAICLLLLASLSFLTATAPALGQSSTGTDALDILKSLTPEQQNEVMGILGGNGTSIGGTGSRDRQSRTDQQQYERETVGRENAPTTSPQGETPPLFPVLTGDDWVIVEIDYRLPPRPVSQNLQAAYLARINPTTLQTLQQNGLSSSQALAALGGGALPGQLSPQSNGGATGAVAPGSNPTGPDLSRLTPEQKEHLDRLIALIRSRNPYQLSHDGALSLPGIPPISLAGLSDDEASLRLKADPAFEYVDIRLTRLPLKKTGLPALKPFGYDLFDRAPSTFAPVTNVPVPADYVIGPGDRLQVELYGSQNRSLQVTVQRDGRINFPEIGPINVQGKLFDEVRADVEARVARQLIGTRASVSMGDTRSIRVFVLGEVKKPGSYVVSGLGTITSALFAAGGVESAGSLRRIELKRQGRVERRLDLYDLLIRGDTTDDTKLLPGDVIFIPPVGPTVSVDGEVRRAAIYEIKSESTLNDVVELAGGLTPDADRSRLIVTRIDDTQRRVVLPVDLGTDAGRAQPMRNGDVLQIARLRPNVDSGVFVQGYVYTPGSFSYRGGLRLTDVLHSVDDLQPNADIHYVLIRRELPPDRRVTVVSADLAAALRSPGSAADIPLMPRDRITVFDLASRRDRTIQPLMDELHDQANADSPTQSVHVDGRVRVPGDYPLESGMTVADLVRAGGGLQDAAYSAIAELTRYTVENGGTRRTELINVDLAAAVRGDAASNIALQPFDSLSVKEVSEWRGQERVTLRGEIRFPGTYAIRRGETLQSVIRRAGGLTLSAFPEGAIFTRLELQRREQDQLDALAGRMQKDLAILAIQATATSTQGSGNAASALSVGQQLFAQLRSTRAVGRLVIDLSSVLKNPSGSNADVILRDGDQLVVPRFQQEVTVIGEVQNSTSHLYAPGLDRDDYISLSGGMSRRADRKSVYVVRANGSVVSNHGSRWFDRSTVTMRPGDTVVVPLDAEHMPPLPYWQAVTQILYNVAIAVAAVHSL
jgi:polysaccharide biosynthesis/export protein